MSAPGDLEALLEVSDLLYTRQRQALVAIMQEEAALRQELARLAEMGGANRETADQSGMKAIGADLLWNGWLARAKTDANIRLAQVLARKDFEQNRVRKAFGKVTALRQIIASQALNTRRTAAKSTLSKAIDHTMLHR
ncbi:MAG: hypothetical protein AAF307_00385 [Pseudomonadota bacterium]